ncbi:uncharacterized protein STEHIDRAFT_158022 [Stereum hirsutum FP-91666 SS1]|uniref:uncharacterized protein n=1 Tax=Stereum hirsutum (strain FP-91666) TaxID=721885 RepID=UPI0004449423|nr:uncharacterized protein STEHIDRAFT_158022 [Stereum hirsutum FP-91666 SS1]EIM85387.1 hypothetical protein STEHIDRAFT_158022 [Stereum hirsutum FP-91666 SS1]
MKPPTLTAIVLLVTAQTWYHHLIPGVLASLVNHTIDDETGDEVTGTLPQYTPASYWNQGSTCTTACAAHPNASFAHGGTWHDTEHIPPDPNQPRVDLFFSGVAIYAYCILGNTIGPLDAPPMNVSISLDQDYVGEFVYTPTTSTDFIYNFPIYANDTLSNGQHTLSLSAVGTTNASLVLFDYAIYTVDTDPTSSSASSATATSTSPPPSQEHSHVGAIVGGTIGGLVGAIVLLLALLFILRRRRRISAGDAVPFTGSDPSLRVEPFISTAFTADNTNIVGETKGQPQSFNSSARIEAQQPVLPNLTTQPSMRSLGTTTNSATELVSPQTTPGPLRLHLHGSESSGSSPSPTSSGRGGRSRSGVSDGEGRHLHDQIMMLRDEIGQLQVLQGVGPPSYTTGEARDV